MTTQFKDLLQSFRKKGKTSDAKQESFTEEPDAAPNTAKTSILHDITHLGLGNTATIAQAVKTLASGEPLDDTECLLEHGVSMLQKSPANSGLSETISDGFIAALWADLPHPALTMAGPSSRYRRHDGGGNNPWDPEMGKAGSPYARNVPPMRPKGPNLPDVESVYEALLKRDGPFREHPSGLNRLFFSFATVVIHECFQTSYTDSFINETSSYVDLSTLYGNTEKEQVRVRTYQNGTIFPDSLASERIMMMPPGVVAVLLLFSRNHNRIAANLLSVNEDGKYKPLEGLSKEDGKWQDEDIFQISRNINVGFFASVVLGDYVASILNTPRANSEWSLNLGKEIKEAGKRVERGNGNLVSIEFAVLYHWHAALSAADDKWMESILRKNFPDLQSLEDVTIDMFRKVLGGTGRTLATTPAKSWTFGGLQRQADGSFKDADLADIIKSCIEEPAHAFGAHGTPLSLKVVDLMGQLQARNVFNACTLNEFRRYLSLKPYENFEAWNPDKETAKNAELLYGHIENLELYPGLMAERTKPPMPGSGVCPGQTTGRGILDDAVSLVRGDRFLSYDFNSNTLTNWGASLFQKTAPGSYCGVLPKLILNGLPGDFTGTSPYALLPFYTPSASKGILQGNKVLEKYEVSRPASGNDIISIQTLQGAKQVFQDDNFQVMYQATTRSYTNKPDAIIDWDDAKRHDERSTILSQAFFEEGFEKSVSGFFRTNVQKLIEKQSLSFRKGKRSIDIVHNVVNITPILWLADRFAIPLKTNEQPNGAVSIYEAFGAYTSVFLYQNFNLLPINEWALRDAAVGAATVLQPVLETHLKAKRGILGAVGGWSAKDSNFKTGPNADRIYHALNETKLPIGDLVADCIGIGAPIASILTKQAALLIDLFLSPGYEQYKKRIIELAHTDTPASEQELQGFVYEGMRHAQVLPGVPRIVTKDATIVDGARGPVHVKAGHKILVARSKIALDPAAFPEPEKLNPHRPFKDYALLGYELNSRTGARLVGSALAATLREVFKLKNVRRASGKLGRFSTVERNLAGIKLQQYLDSNSRESLIPTSLTLDYDV